MTVQLSQTPSMSILLEYEAHAVSSLWTVFDMGHQTHRQAGLVADVCLKVVHFDIKLFRKAVYVL